MTEAQLRALVREAVARHLGETAASSLPPPAEAAPEPDAHPLSAGAPDRHPSQAIYVTVVNAGDACVIEPDVSCTHCHYCRTHGY